MSVAAVQLLLSVAAFGLVAWCHAADRADRAGSDGRWLPSSYQRRAWRRERRLRR